MPTPMVYAVILNWNGWADTIACLNSLLSAEYERLSIVVCDNASSDDSVQHILDWATKHLSRRETENRPLEASMGEPLVVATFVMSADDRQLFVLKNRQNLGFAGGNNVGISFALARGDMHYAWILNNDTAVEPTTLNRMLEKIESVPEAGICGSTLVFFDRRHLIQERGGTFDKWFARTRPIGRLEEAHLAVDEDLLASKLDFIAGASMLVSKSFIRDIGLMDERYFLYFEEMDWIFRARGRYTFCYSSRSRVFHKGGSSTGANNDTKSCLGEYYGTRGRLLFTKKYYPFFMPTVLLAISSKLLFQLLRGHSDIARAVLGGCLDGLRGRSGFRDVSAFTAQR